MRWASTGPTPGSPSSWSSVAVLRSTSPPPPAPPPPPEGAPGPAAVPPRPVTPTSTCSPSVSSRAKLMVVRSTPGKTPPAAASASATLDPGGSRTSPGRRTRPATWTTTSAAPTAADPLGAPEAAGVATTPWVWIGIGPGDSASPCGADRSASHAAQATPIAATSAIAATAVGVSRWANPRAAAVGSSVPNPSGSPSSGDDAGPNSRARRSPTAARWRARCASEWGPMPSTLAVVGHAQGVPRPRGGQPRVGENRCTSPGSARRTR